MVKELKKEEDAEPIWPVSSDSLREPNRRLYTTRSFKYIKNGRDKGDEDGQLSAKESLISLKSMQNLEVKYPLKKKVSFKLEAAKATPALHTRKASLACSEDFALVTPKI